MSKKTRNIALGAIIAAGVASSAYIWVSFGYKPKSEDALAISGAKEGNMVLDGSVVAEKSADLGFVLPAKITSIAKKVGDSVKGGEVLATEDSSDMAAQENAAQANVQSAQAALDGLSSNLKVQKLKLKGLDGNDRKIQKAQIESVEASIDAQNSAVAAAKDSAASLKAQLSKAVLLAPFDGIVTRQDAEIGEVAGASVPSFMTIESNGPMDKIEAYASDLDVANIKVGDAAQVKFDITGTEEFSGKISEIGPAADRGAKKGTYKVTVILDKANGALRTGMHASVIFAK
ncbi:MAG TPA: efflux RND transporter periplasmic adaptor subunit [Patescibacteria group bacterium]